MDDTTLIRRFVDTEDDDAFREIVDRHIPLVYSAALRQAADPGLAEDICQSVFIVLARKAADLDDRTVLSGWLYRTTRFTALRALKAERRRAARERDAMTTQPDDDNDESWDQLAPNLDEAMSKLDEKDRNALILRFFENRKLNEVGASLGLSEDAAQKRVTRALEKMRRFFTRRAIPISSVALTTALSSKAVAAAPAKTASATASAALLQGAAAPAATLTLVKGTLNAMAWTKIKTTAALGVAIIVAGTPAFIQSRTNADLRAENLALTEQNRRLSVPAETLAAPDGPDLEQLKRTAAEVHELRARLAAAMRAETVLKQALAKQANEAPAAEAPQDPLPQGPQEEALAAEAENFAIRMNEMKHFGLAFHNWVNANNGRPPKSLEEMLAASQLDAGQSRDILERFRFFDHSETEHGRNWPRSVMLAERLPTQTLKGERVWLYTMLDGSVRLSAVPVPETGIFPPGAQF